MDNCALPDRLAGSSANEIGSCLFAQWLTAVDAAHMAGTINRVRLDIGGVPIS